MNRRFQLERCHVVMAKELRRQNHIPLLPRLLDAGAANRWESQKDLGTMRQSRIGELLKRNRRITDHDIEEILHEQNCTPRLFGEIALSWGLCQPQDVWSAWFGQLTENSTVVDIDQLGVDAQAIEFVPRSLAMEFRILPLRLFSDGLVAAVAVETSPPRTAEIRQSLGKDVRFVRARAAQICAAMEEHYGAPCLPA